LKESLLAGELAAVEEARDAIKRRGWREGFRFGTFLRQFDYPKPKPGKARHLLGLMNYATLCFHWSRFEPRPREKEWSKLDQVADWAMDQGIDLKGHPLLYMNSLGLPEWVRTIDFKDPNTFKPLVREFASDIVEHWQDSIFLYDVINEAHDWANVFGYSQEQLIDLTRFMCDITWNANRQAIRLVNSVFEWGQYVAFDATCGSLGRGETSSRPLMSVYDYLQRCIAEGIEFEAIGLQVSNPTQDMFEIGLMLERYARLGKPIHITELGIPSQPIPACIPRGYEVPGYHRFRGYDWHGPWTEELQADYLERFYTLCYSKQFVTAVTVSRFVDNEPAGTSFFTGLLRSDCTAKPAYYRLKSLIDGWKSV
jgi:hypothetical protein